MFSCFRWPKLIVVRYGVLATLVRVRRRNALALEAAIRGLATRCASRETVKGPEKQDYYHQADGDVKATSHPESE